MVGLGLVLWRGRVGLCDVQDTNALELYDVVVLVAVEEWFWIA